ncbi:hypothetical protein BS47DRAFT_1358506, partial [Hydnum rufescens UP504]
MSFALASDISAQIAQGFEDIPAATIRGQHDVLYDSWDADLRVEIEDLEGLPLLDDSEKEIRIYNQEGNRVPRREPLFYGDEAPCGVLLNLATCEALFVLEPSMIDEGEEHVYVSVYPQAYLRHIGHMRANCVMRDFRAVIKRINNTITHPEGESDDSDDEIEAEYLSARPAALRGTSFQAYNEMVHRFTDRHGGMDIQQGSLTAAASGRYARDARDVRTAKGRSALVDELLPHERMTEKMELENSPRDLRLEQVYTLDLHCMPEEHRNGRYIYRNIILPLTEAWRSPSLATQLKDHLVVLTPECYPHIYDWVSYPVQAMLSMAWRQVSLQPEHDPKDPKTLPSPYLVEVMTLLERSLAYAYTGSA